MKALQYGKWTATGLLAAVLTLATQGCKPVSASSLAGTVAKAKPTPTPALKATRATLTRSGSLSNSGQLVTCPAGMVLYSDGWCRASSSVSGNYYSSNTSSAYTCPPGMILYTDGWCRQQGAAQSMTGLNPTGMASSDDLCPSGMVLYSDGWCRAGLPQMLTTGGSESGGTCLQAGTILYQDGYCRPPPQGYSGSWVQNSNQNGIQTGLPGSAYQQGIQTGGVAGGSVVAAINGQCPANSTPTQTVGVCQMLAGGAYGGGYPTAPGQSIGTPANYDPTGGAGQVAAMNGMCPVGTIVLGNGFCRYASNSQGQDANVMSPYNGNCFSGYILSNDGLCHGTGVTGNYNDPTSTLQQGPCQAGLVYGSDGLCH